MHCEVPPGGASKTLAQNHSRASRKGEAWYRIGLAFVGVGLCLYYAARRAHDLAYAEPVLAGTMLLWILLLNWQVARRGPMGAASLEVLFAIAFELFHGFGYLHAMAFDLPLEVYESELLHGAFLQSQAYLVAWLAGFTLVTPQQVEPNRDGFGDKYEAVFLRSGCYVAVGIGLVCLFAFFRSVGGLWEILTSNYGASVERYSANHNWSTVYVGWGLLALRCGVTGLMLLNLAEDRAFCWRRPFNILYLLPAVLFAATGDRSSLVIHIVPLAICYAMFVRPPRVVKALGVVAVALGVFSMLKVYRGTKGEGLRVGVQKGVEGMISTDIFDETNGTLDVVIRGLSVLRDAHFWNGASFLHSFAKLVPNISGTPRDFMGTAAWITATTEPQVFAIGGGLGSSYVLEAYVNFGPLGGLAFCLVTGCLVGAAYTYALATPGFAARAWAILMASFLLYSVRNEVSNTIRPIVYGGAYFCLLAFVARRSFRGRRYVEDRAGEQPPDSSVRTSL